MSTPSGAGTVEHGVEHWAYQAQSPFRDPAEIRELSSAPASPPGRGVWNEDEFDVEAEYEAYEESDTNEDASFEDDYLTADLLEEAEGSDHPLASVFRLPRLAFDAMAKGGWATAIAIAVGTGQRDISSLTNMVFWFRHPQLIGQKLRSDQVDLAREWVQIRDGIVRPTLAGQTSTAAPTPAVPTYTQSPGSVGTRTSIPPDDLRWYGPPGELTPELLAFMRKVYLAHVARSVASDKNNTFVDTLPSSALANVSHPAGEAPPTQRARKDAAAKALEMFAAAQAALEAQNLQGQVRFGVLSGYRSADRQFGIWQGKFTGGKGGFPQYYEETKKARSRLPGGEFGDHAVAMLATTIAGNVAAPGYSNHQDGLALDLGTRKGKGGRLYKVYDGSWFHNWLSANAKTYDFNQQLKNEPWHWVYRPPNTSGEAEWSQTEAWTHEVVPTSVPAGKMKVPTLRVLAGHRGKGKAPDAVLHWNAMRSVPQEIDVVVHLHGFAGAGKTLLNHFETWAGLDLAPVDGVTGGGRTRPTLTVLPRGNNTGILTRKGNLYKYTFPALTTRNGLDELVRECLQQFADRVGGLEPKVGRLILTAHSGGGAPLMRILRQRRDDPQEAHVFDGLYEDPTALAEWAVGHIRVDRKAVEAGGVPSGAMRVFYGPSTRANSLRLRDAIAGALRGAPDSVTARYRVEASTLGHWQIPRQYGWRILADPATDVPDAVRPPGSQHRVRNQDEFDTSESPMPAPTWSESEQPEDEWEDEGDLELEGLKFEEPETWGEGLVDEMHDEEEDLQYEDDEEEDLQYEDDEDEGFAFEGDEDEDEGFEPEDGYSEGAEVADEGEYAELEEMEESEEFEDPDQEGEGTDLAEGFDPVGYEDSFADEAIAVEAAGEDDEYENEVEDREAEAQAAGVWQGTAAQVAFREKVLAEAIARKAQQRPPQPDLPASRLRLVPGTRIAMRADAAEAADRLLAAANADLAVARAAGHPDAARTRSIGAVSGYRPRANQERVWRRYFGGYYGQTAVARAALPGGPHGAAAVAYLLETFGIPRRVAAPGYSNHQNGIAIDVAQVRERGAAIRNSTQKSAVAAWRKTWFFGWLTKQAYTFGFTPYEREPWHWEYTRHSGSAAPTTRRELDEFELGESTDLADIAERVASHGELREEERPRRRVRWTGCFTTTDIQAVRQEYADNLAAVAASGSGDRASCIVMLNVALGRLLGLPRKSWPARSGSTRRVQMADLTTRTIGLALARLTSLGYAREPVTINFLDARGRRAGTLRPERLDSSVISAVLARAPRQGCHYAFAMSLMDGYHSVLLLVDKTGTQPMIEWFDQFSPRPQDVVTSSLDDRVTERTRTYWQDVMNRKQVGYNTPVRLWMLRKRLAA